MSEEPECPYCGSSVHPGSAMDYDNKIKLRCSNCGSFFEFMPGFGAFTLPEQERSGQRSSVRHEGFRPHYEVYESEAPWETERHPPAQSGSCGTACFVILCFCCFLPILTFIFMLVLGIGLFWF